MPAQSKQTMEITQKLLDSLSAYPQVTMQSDLYYKLVLEKYPNTHEAYMSRSVPYNKGGEHATGYCHAKQGSGVSPYTKSWLPCVCKAIYDARL